MTTFSILYNNNRYDMPANAFRSVMTELGYSEETNPQASDIIIIMGHDYIDTGINHKRQNSKIILFFFKSEIYRNIDIPINLIDKIFIGVDSNIKVLYPWPNLCEEIVPPTINSLLNQPLTNDIDVLVDIRAPFLSDIVLLKIVRFLNKLSTYKIVVLNNSMHSTIFNSHIQLIQQYSDQYIKSAHTVIGSGYAALEGLLFGKKVIVIGERGYGGIPTVNNINLFYADFFQGAIGGRLDGPIPEPLFFEDVQTDISNSIETTEPITRLVEHSLNILKEKIYRVVEQPLQHISFNTDFTIIKSAENRFWLLNRYTRQLISNLTPNIANKLLLLYKNSDSSILTITERTSLIEQKILISTP